MSTPIERNLRDLAKIISVGAREVRLFCSFSTDSSDNAIDMES